MLLVFFKKKDWFLFPDNIFSNSREHQLLIDNWWLLRRLTWRATSYNSSQKDFLWIHHQWHLIYDHVCYVYVMVVVVVVYRNDGSSLNNVNIWELTSWMRCRGVGLVWALPCMIICNEIEEDVGQSGRIFSCQCLVFQLFLSGLNYEIVCLLFICRFTVCHNGKDWNWKF